MKKPVNEMGVVSLFAQYAQSLGYVIMGIQAAFPDAIVYEIKTDRMLRVEFEYVSKNFHRHKHDPAGCDLIICWEHDWKECPLPVMQLWTIHEKEPVEDLTVLMRRRDELKASVDRELSELSELRMTKDQAKDYIAEKVKLKRQVSEMEKSVAEHKKARQDYIHELLNSPDKHMAGSAKVQGGFVAAAPIFCKCGREIGIHCKKKGEAALLVNGVLLLKGVVKCSNCGKEKYWTMY
jgi:hypothetical protein